jgi:hypothetical protein
MQSWRALNGRSRSLNQQRVAAICNLSITQYIVVAEVMRKIAQS